MLDSTAATDDIRALSLKLQALHGRILTVERRLEFGADGKGILDRLTGDPAWAWLRALSSFIADIDHATAGELTLPEDEKAVVASHARGLLFGEGRDVNSAFLERYRPLLQKDAELASLHGEIRALLKKIPLEGENESQRLHARHQWAERCRHRTVRA